MITWNRVEERRAEPRRGGMERTGGRSITGRCSARRISRSSPGCARLRKEIAQADAVPVYTIFTNEQLAQMVQARATTKAALEQVAGVGDARIEKYGARMLEVLRTQWGQGGKGKDAAGQPPV